MALTPTGPKGDINILIAARDAYSAQFKRVNAEIRKIRLANGEMLRGSMKAQDPFKELVKSTTAIDGNLASSAARLGAMGVALAAVNQTAGSFADSWIKAQESGLKLSEMLPKLASDLKTDIESLPLIGTLFKFGQGLRAHFDGSAAELRKTLEELERAEHQNAIKDRANAISEEIKEANKQLLDLHRTASQKLRIAFAPEGFERDYEQLMIDQANQRAQRQKDLQKILEGASDPDEKSRRRAEFQEIVRTDAALHDAQISQLITFHHEKARIEREANNAMALEKKRMEEDLNRQRLDGLRSIESEIRAVRLESQGAIAAAERERIKESARLQIEAAIRAGDEAKARALETLRDLRLSGLGGTPQEPGFDRGAAAMEARFLTRAPNQFQTDPAAQAVDRLTERFLTPFARAVENQLAGIHSKIEEFEVYN